jgi:murein DD-endopeptidase MepM/ murein hydrolase activator NlpD
MKSKNTYSLPLKKNSVYLAISDTRAHYSYWKHAVDFAIDFNVPIIAPLDGEIWNVKDDANDGGNDEKYAAWKYQNLITIKHAGNEYSQYVHLAHKSALVKIGDKVKRGDPIAKGVGMVGYTTTPHLHMMVFNIVDTNEDKFESLKINFDKELKIIRTGEEHIKELNKPINKKLKELEEKYHNS